MVLGSWRPTRQLRIWDWTMQADNWASAIGAENWVLCHWVEFSTVAAAVKFFGSQPAKMNWDLKHYEMYRTLEGVVSIVWLRKTFKYCVSLRNQKFINGSYLNNGVACAFVFCNCISIHVVYNKRIRSFQIVTRIMQNVWLTLDYATESNMFLWRSG